MVTGLCGIQLRFLEQFNLLCEIRKADESMDASLPLDLHACPAL
ncbi:hypothetical protein Rleg4DRAFT_7430 [Rhizobium leguminosarum bv. trifolii WSM2297]|uniref:Uncharacterized protein n=1 Tax=Rhizobium leguminosarum bv. trifolii WSM2297 TaxID=754762 RepID=J0WJ79_RHILT|nr:hypothetical protein Rleg4DRAFT_7430 [Rhizobium leguminosarum bv. trifolii WSM2297]